MGSKLELYKEYFEAAWANPPSSLVEATTKYFSDDFQSLDKDGNAEMNKEAYIGVSQLLFSSFKDFKYVYKDRREEGDTVFVRGHFEGIHSADLDISAMGMGVIPASGKLIVWPDSTVAFMYKGDKIVNIKPLDDNGGMQAFMSALGVTPPSV